MPQPRSDRLIDLHCDWLLQYATETSVFDPSLYGEVTGRLKQVDGYLQDTAAAVLACFRRATDWSRQADPWTALGDLITRLAAEFPGRLLIGPDDLTRWRDEPDGLCWAVIGVEGFDALIRSREDLARLASLFDRGVRVFLPSYTSKGLLAGSSEPGDDRGLTELGRAFLESLLELAAPNGPRPALDLAHLSPLAMSEVLAWFEAETSRADLLLPVYGHGAPVHADFDRPRAITVENLGRLRRIGGFVGFSVGPPFFPSAESLKASIDATAGLPFVDRAGYEGVAIGTDFLGVDGVLPGLANAGEVIAWLVETFDESTAYALMRGNAERFVSRLAGQP
jgi:membrane dipeptidase